jgi:lysophospholipid acyltransferase (LPLAT)-like uncharacterized protein
VRIRDRIAVGLSGVVGPPILRALYAGLKFDVVGEENQEIWTAGKPVVFITWHGRLLPLLYLYRGEGLVMLVSQHRDGEYLTRIGHGLGYDSVRGSSTHGGFPALRHLVRKLRSGLSLAITPDGPQGPREKLKPGALQAARMTGTPVIPVMAGASRAWWIEGWDRFLIPKPFAKIRVAIGEPRYIPRETSVRDLETQARQLEDQLRTLKAAVDDAPNGRGNG